MGENHAYTADSYNNVGYFYWLLGRQLVALEYLKKFFDIEKLWLGAEAEVTIEAQKKLQYVQTHPVHDPNDEEERNTLVQGRECLITRHEKSGSLIQRFRNNLESFPNIEVWDETDCPGSLK